jgi:ADP-ribose pyrophosphatase YjhB (NUDIX family)
VAAGVAAVVFDGSGRVLLGKRADNALWGLPSGKVEPAESVTEAVKREIREETGLGVEVERLIGVYSEPESQTFSYPTGEVVQFVTACFSCTAVGGTLRADGVEALDAAFFDPERLPADLLPMHPRWLSDALSGEGSASTR